MKKSRKKDNFEVSVMDVLRNAAKSRTSANYAKKVEYKCMNCGKQLDSAAKGPYERRFCCFKCQEEYLTPNKDSGKEYYS